MSRKHDQTEIASDEGTAGLCEPSSVNDRRNGRRFAVACLLWASVFVAASQTLRAESGPSGPAAWIIAASCVVLGVIALGAFRQFVQEADELTRRIQLEGVAFGFGVGVLFGLSYGLFALAGAPDIEMTHVATVLVLGYVVGVMRATRQYV